MGPARTYLLLEKKSLRGGACKAQIGERPGLQVQRGLILFSASITMCWSHVCLFDPLGQPFEVGANVTFSQEGNLQHRSITNFHSLCNISVYLGHSMSFLIEFLPPFDM